ncbi:MAG: hypothetical protein EBR83_00415 [Verrucomicrobia bacterium]|nr:hypothetical protein [Verrucomicrobiota bacterium]
MKSFILILILVTFTICGCNPNRPNRQTEQKMRLVEKSVHVGDTAASVIQFADAQGWHHERFPKAEESALFSSQEYDFFCRIYDQSRSKDFELLVAFDSTGKVMKNGITIYYLPLFGPRGKFTPNTR